MKILQINPYPPENLGGSEIFCKNLSIHLKQNYNIYSDILTSDILKRKIKKDVISNNINIIYKKCYHNLWGKNPIVNIYSYIQKNYHKYDLIHAHSYIFFTSLQSAFFRKIKEIPLILHIHGGVYTPQYMSLNFNEKLQLYFKNQIFDKIIGKFTVKNADALISVSKRDLNLLKKRYNISNKLYYYIPNAIDTDKFKININYDRDYITFIGRLSYIKGLDKFIHLIESLYKLNKNLKFRIIGSGRLLHLVIEARKKYPIEYFHSFPYDQMNKIYNTSKLLVISSRFEGVPTILLESLACGTPVVANNIGGISEVLLHKYNGLIFNDINDNDSIMEILNLIQEENLLNQFGQRGRQLILKKFTWKVITKKINKIYEKLVNF